jgi:hypothetical protein
MTTTATIDSKSRVKVASSIYARPFGSELVLLDFGRGEYFGLDDVGADIWRRCEAGDSLAAIASTIVERYEVPYEAALRDIVALVTHMRDKGLLAIVPSESNAP